MRRIVFICRSISFQPRELDREMTSSGKEIKCFSFLHILDNILLFIVQCNYALLLKLCSRICNSPYQKTQFHF